MRQALLKGWLVPLLLIGLVAVFYFLPYYQGYRFRASDQISGHYMAYPLEKLEAQTGKVPFWTPNQFSGMPAYLIYHKPAGVYWVGPVEVFGRLFRVYPPTILFVGLLGFFLFLRAEGASWSAALAGAFAFGMMSYYTNMIVATHWGKSNVLFTAPYALAGLSLLYQGRWGWGLLLSLWGWAGMVGGNHPQMLYYVLVLFGGYGLYRFWMAWQNRAWRRFWLATGLVVLSVGAAGLSQIAKLLPYYTYGQYSIRGGSELEREQEKDPSLRSGLDKSYAQSYSANRAEVWTLLIPDVVGGTSSEDVLKRLGNSSSLVQAFRQYGIADQSFLRQVPLYWGGSPFSAGSFYAGIIPFFLLVLGLLYKADSLDWILLYVGWLVIQLALGAYGYSLWASVVLLALPWGSFWLGRRFSEGFRPFLRVGIFLVGWGLVSILDSEPEAAYKLTDAVLAYLPFYNKFRAPSTFLVVMGFLWGWGGVRGVMRFVEAPSLRKVGVALALTAGVVAVVGFGVSFWFDLSGAVDAELRSQRLPEWFFAALVEDRITIAQHSTLTVLLWLLLAGGILGAYAQGYFRGHASLVALAGLILVDGWLVNSRYFPRQEVYMRNVEFPTDPPKAPYELYLEATDSSFYRILAYHTSPFTDARPGIYLENAGGYHPAKLKRYQQLIDAHLARLEPGILQMLGIRYVTAFADRPLPLRGFDSVKTFPDGITLYRFSGPIKPAWLAESLVVYPRIDQTLDSLSRYDLMRVAVLARKDLEALPLLPASAPLDSTEAVTLLQRSPAYEIKLRVQAERPRLLVLSEIHYPPDWVAFVDGKPTPIVYTNFVLRGFVVPAGRHEVRVVNQSAVHAQGARLSLWGSVTSWLLAVGGIAFLIWKRKPTI